MLYKNKQAPKLEPELFKNPTCEYRGMPFWAWNTKLDCEELSRQIDIFKEMGYGGFYMHVRQGLETDYLGEDFMTAIKSCTQKARQEEMYACLYDEDRWPSGCAGGIVTKEKRYRKKYLSMTVSDRSDDAKSLDEHLNEGKSFFLGAFDVEFNSDGIMTSYRQVDRNEECPGKRYFFIDVAEGGEPRFNYQSYSDNMNKECVDKFISTTYDAFKENVGEEFGKTVPFIFTDEPQVNWGAPVMGGFSREESFKPWTHDFADTYFAQYGETVTDRLPELFFDLPDKGSAKVRYNYYRHISERFSTAYMDNIGSWCENNGIMFTGHILGEDSLYESACNLGDTMRTYKNMQFPGIDILCDDRVFTTAKQCQSVVHQYGREGMLSEMYGVTGWDFDFRGHKFQGDWQACLGVTHRVPHLAWQTMKGEGKRDYPASISYQSPWYREYRIIEDHFARVSTAMTRGVPVVRAAVIHPIETYWMYVTTNAEAFGKCKELDSHFAELAQWLLEGCVDFDYLAESLLEDICPEGSAPLKAGKMTYDTVIVADCETLRPHTLKILEQFKANGGRLIFVGNTPKMSMAVESDKARALSENTVTIPHSRYDLLEALRDCREVKIHNSDGSPTENLMYAMRQDGEDRWMYIAHTRTPQLQLYHISTEQKITVTVKGAYTPVLYNTMNGDISPMDFECDGKETKISCTVYDFDSLLIKLEPRNGAGEYAAGRDVSYSGEIRLSPCCEYSLAEPNVLVLDMPQYSLDGEPWQDEEEILRIDEIIRKRLGLDLRRTKVVQPYYIKNVPEDHILKLQFKVSSMIDAENTMLAMENAAKATITLNGEAVPSEICGWYVDKYIDTVKLPRINKGENILEIAMPFGQRTDLENCFLLGDFGTGYAGVRAYITEKPEKLYFGNAVNQGMAFYGGNIEYSSTFTLDEAADVEFEVSCYRGAMLRVFADGKDTGAIAFPPFKAKAENLPAGEHEVKFVLYGNRYNTFSALHTLLADKKRVYIGPDYWRSADEGWAYEYQTRPMGILKTPVVRIVKQEEF